MIKYKTVKEPKQVIDKVVCNCCGNEITNDEYVHINQHWGYESKKDFEEHTFDICEGCYDKMVSNFKIKPQIEEYSLIG